MVDVSLFLVAAAPFVVAGVGLLVLGRPAVWVGVATLGAAVVALGFGLVPGSGATVPLLLTAAAIAAAGALVSLGRVAL